MYAARYFPGDYFARRYFPVGLTVTPTTKPGYFLHSYFALRYYPDRYFPGHIPVLVPPTPTPPSLAGGRPVRADLFADQIALVAELQLPDITLQSLLQVRPALVQVLLDGALDGPTLEALVRTVPAGVDVATVQSLGLEMVSLVYVDRPRRKSTEDEDLLLMHYLLSLKEN